MERSTSRPFAHLVVAMMLIPACALAATSSPAAVDYSLGTLIAGFACGMALGGGLIFLAAPICAHFVYRMMDET